MNLKALQAAVAKLSPTELARASGVSRRTVYRVRNGDLPTVRNFQALVAGVQQLRRKS